MPGGGAKPLICVWMVCFHMYSVLGGFEHVCSSGSKPHPDGICGNMISETLHLLCMGNYNIPHIPQKRSDGLQLYEDDYPSLSPLESVIIGKRDALSYLGSRRQSRGTRNIDRGVVCECCYHQCDFHELSQYCDFSRKKRDTRQISNVEDRSLRQ